MKIADFLSRLVRSRLNSVNLSSTYGLKISLQKLLGKKQLLRLQRVIPDRRMLIEEAARQKGVCEEELIRHIAREIGVPVIFRPKAPDIDCITCGITFQDLRNAAVVPVTALGFVSGVVCLDPADLNQIPDLYNGSNIYLGSRKAILTAIDQAEQNYIGKKKLAISESRLNIARIANQALGKIVAQALRENAQRVFFSHYDHGLEYNFMDEGGISWNGSVDPEIAANLISFMQESIASGDTMQKVLYGADEVVTVELMAENEKIIIVLPASLADPVNEILSQPKDAGSRILPFPSLLRSDRECDLAAYSQLQDRLHILLIDDNQHFAFAMQKFFARQKIEVSCCYSIRTALKELKERSGSLPDLIVSDFYLPGENGLEFIRLLKNSPDWKHIPVLALTSDDNSETEIKMLECGVDAFVLKSKDPRILSLHVRKLAESRRAA